LDFDCPGRFVLGTVSQFIGAFLLRSQRNFVGDMVLDYTRENKGKGMINFVAILDIVMVLAVLAAVAGLVRRTHDYFLFSTRLLLACLLFFMLLYGTCLAIEWLGITKQLDAFEDYIGALLPMWWAFVFYGFLHETDLQANKTLNRELEKRVVSLQEAELRFRTIFHSASDGILIAHAGGKHFFSANDKMCEMLGYTKEELLGMNVSDLHPKESIPYVYQQFARVAAKEVPAVQDIPFLKKDRTVFFADISGSKMTFDKEDYLIGIFRDVTERKQAEENLIKSEKKFSSIFHLNPNPLAITDVATGQFIDVNEAFVQWTGYSREEIIGASSHDLHLWANPKDREKIIKTLTEKGEANGIEIVMRLKNGQVRDLLFSAQFIEIEHKRYLLTLAHDITARKRAEEKYRNIFDNATEGIYQITLGGKLITANKALARMTGYESPEELMESINDIQNQLYVHPEERERFLEILKEKNFVYGFETELYRKNRSHFWVDINAAAVKNEKGEILYIEGLLEDITLRKETEEKLRQSLEQLRRAINTTIQVLVSALEARDPYTTGHQSRAADLACTIAEEMELAKEKIEGIRMAGIIHDIGKLSVPAEILSKPTRLTTLEYDLIKQHPQSGFEMLKNVESPWPLAQIVYQHHERMNGTGYPRKLKGDEILLEARILAVADVVEAMASHRPYRPSLGINVAIEEIEKNKGILYDTAAADACIKLFREKGYHLRDGG